MSRLRRAVQPARPGDRRPDHPERRGLGLAGGNVPLFDCPDKDIEEIYYFRWWTYRKHIKQTPDGFIVTEFLPTSPGRASTTRSVARPATTSTKAAGCATRVPRRLLVFWFRKGGEPRRYSFWAADAICARYLVTGDEPLRDRPAARPGRELRGVGEEPTATPTACSGRSTTATAWRSRSAAAATGPRSTATCTAMRWPSPGSPSWPARRTWPSEFRAKAARIKQLVQEKLWDAEARVLQGLAARRDDPTGRCPRTARLHAVVLQPAGSAVRGAWKQIMDPQGFLRPVRPDHRRAAPPAVRVA